MTCYVLPALSMTSNFPTIGSTVPCRYYCSNATAALLKGCCMVTSCELFDMTVSAKITARDAAAESLMHHCLVLSELLQRTAT